MTTPERIALRWEPGAAVTNGPLMTHPDYTRYIREDVAQTYHDAWLTAEAMLEEAQCQIKAMKDDAAKPRVKPLEWRGDTDFWRAPDVLGGYYEVIDANAGVYLTHTGDGTGRVIPTSPKRNPFHEPTPAQAAAQADYEARILSALVLP